MRDVLSRGPLTHAACLLLDSRIRSDDRKECYIQDTSPLEALTEAAQWTSHAVWGRVNGQPLPVGAFGLRDRSIWSLWTDDLTPAMKRCIFRNTPKMVLELVLQSPTGVLDNHCLDGNHQVRKWLHHSGCFDIAPRPTLLGRDRVSMRHFQTKPIHQLLQKVNPQDAC